MKYKQGYIGPSQEDHNIGREHNNRDTAGRKSTKGKDFTNNGGED